MLDGPTTRGIFSALFSLLGLTLLTTVPAIIGDVLNLTVVGLPEPSAELLRGIASLGGALVLAFIVQVAWMVRETSPHDDDGWWVGLMTGFGIAGFTGVVLALLLAEHRAAGYDNALDVIGNGWVYVSQGALAGGVLLQPVIVFRLMQIREGQDGPAAEETVR